MAEFPKLGIIAGGGSAPKRIIEHCLGSGREYFLICLEGNADSDLGCGHPHIWLPLGAGEKLKSAFLEHGIKEAIMIGKVRRPSLLELKPDWLALKVVTKIGMNSLGDDGLLRSVGRAVEEETGVRMIGIQDVIADILSEKGPITSLVPDEAAMNDIRRGISVAKSLGALDVGQAAVVQQGIVLGVEAIEGTDALIKRSAELRRDGAGGVLVKLAKPQQDDRFDLPAIGAETVKNAAAAGLRGIAVQSGRSLLLEREKTLGEAERLKIFIYGLSGKEVKDA